MIWPKSVEYQKYCCGLLKLISKLTQLLRHLIVDFNIWYRHSGQPEKDIPERESYSNYSEYMYMEKKTKREVITDVGEHHITHLITTSEGLQSLHTMLSELTYLRLESISDSSHLKRYLLVCLSDYVDILSLSVEISIS